MRTDPNDAVIPNNNNAYTKGLTKLEFFAAMAMQGILANSNAKIDAEEIAESSLIHADALIAELNKETK